ncbi:MAG: TlpA family protein disulfide reductase [Clostridia bacterium]|nr:TlpA family protein disulfide reductase [Clostridia bacterium]MBQ8369295.1 TlpA family protein disulfide reductase [Clostridia bacterium]MBQ8513641.1 TlpA family protein disulfide reductase [Clostridia bacterium]
MKLKQTHKTVITAAALLVVLAGAVIGYNALTKIYSPENFTPDKGMGLSADTGASETGETVTVGREPDTTADNAETAEEIDYTAPEFTVYDEEGNAVQLSDFFGKPLVVNFWASWCGPCKSEMPYFDAAASSRDDVTILMVNLTDGQRDTVDSVKKFAEDEGYSFPLYFDTDTSAANAYYVYSIPMTVFIAADGTLADYHTGAMSEETLNAYLDLLVEYSASLETAQN